MSEHSFSFFNQESHCNACGLSRAQCEDGFSCGRRICVECTLLRQCIGDPPRCEECFLNIQGSSTIAFSSEASTAERLEAIRLLGLPSWKLKR